jgi:hypothetical protein
VAYGDEQHAYVFGPDLKNMVSINFVMEMFTLHRNVSSM